MTLLTVLTPFAQHLLAHCLCHHTCLLFAHRSLPAMNNMSALEEALDILPLTITVNERAVKEAVITQLVQELCLGLRQTVPSSAFSVSEDIMKQALALALIVTQQKVISNPPSFVKIAKKYQRRSITPAILAIRAACPTVVPVLQAHRAEVKAQTSAAAMCRLQGLSCQLAAFLLQTSCNPEVLKTAKLWRFQKLSKAELIGLVEHYTKVSPATSATNGQLIKALMDYAASGAQ